MLFLFLEAIIFLKKNSCSIFIEESITLFLFYILLLFLFCNLQKSYFFKLLMIWKLLFNNNIVKSKEKENSISLQENFCRECVIKIRVNYVRLFIKRDRGDSYIDCLLIDYSNGEDLTHLDGSLNELKICTYHIRRSTWIIKVRMK